ncbi:MAG: AAA family ATPase, partial [Rhodocyclaceae bacterium]|nr:AAA family ATPase [Rhodocyclaceae bacterium]
MPDDPPPLIRALLDPARYPQPVATVELLETHISWVLLAGDRAYKIKKPVTLPFLDYGTLDKRQACCEAELRLNRRYAPELYLDVVAITGTPDAPLLGGTGTAIEYAVGMRRFAEAARLDHLASRDELTPAHMSLLAAEIADFHDRAAVAAADTRFGTPEQTLAPVLENFAELARLMPAETDRRRLAGLAAWTRHEFKQRRAAFAARKQAGRVRECHGDLHLGNLALIDGRVVPFDCIEFNEDFRWNDVVSEIAFVWIDLLDHRQPGLAAWLLNAWLELSGDFEALAVLRFYAVYRAVVRAKVATLRARQEGARQGLAELDSARAYLQLAWQTALPPAPALIITCGLSGSGKTTASSACLLDPTAAPAGGTLRLRSDVERKRLFGLAPQD